MPDRYGFTQQEWENGKTEMRNILREVASRKAMISYIDLSRSVTSIRIGHHEAAMGKMLGEISKDEDLIGHGMLSVIVVHKLGEMEPGNGFL